MIQKFRKRHTVSWAVYDRVLYHNVEITEILTHGIFVQKFRESKDLMNKLLNSWFDEIFFGERNLFSEVVRVLFGLSGLSIC